jgi:hypothetical protein
MDVTVSHNPKVAGSNPAPATIENEGLADATAASPFRLPRLHPGIGPVSSLRGVRERAGVGGRRLSVSSGYARAVGAAAAAE